MRIFHSRQGKLVILVTALVIIVAGVYLNRAYAHIYNTIGRVDLQSSDRSGYYFLSPSETELASSISSTSPLIFAALGDSLTAGVGTADYKESYPYLVAQDLASAGGRPVELYDRGIPGERSGGLIKDLLPEAVKDQPDVVTLFIGINDIHGLISRQAFRQNYDTILKTLTARTKAKIYTVNLPYLGAPNLVLFPYTDILNWRTKQFNRIIKEESAKYQVHDIDLYTPTLKLFKNSGALYAADSFHASPTGYALLANIIYANINR